MNSKANQRTFVVILAGGNGTRFWPISRKSKPKQFHAIVGETDLLSTTLHRAEQIADQSNIIVVASQIHQGLLESYRKKFPRVTFLLEPVGKNTGPSIVLAAAFISKKSPNATMVVLSSDHYIGNELAWHDDIKVGIETSQTNQKMIIFGVLPNFAHTGYGYIHSQNSHKKVSNVVAFCEKPNKETAEVYLKTGAYFWNSGMFVFQVQQLISIYKKEFSKDLDRIDAFLTATNPNEKEALFKNITSISIDYAVLEKFPDETQMIKADFNWSDIGCWSALAEYLNSYDENKGNHPVISHNASENIFFSTSPKTAVLMDVNNLIVVNTQDTILVLPKSSDQKLKDVLSKLPEPLQ